MEEPIAVLGGTGALGSGLARRWASAGRTVVIGSRSAERAAQAAAEIASEVPGALVEGRSNAEAAERAEVVFLAVPFSAQAEHLRGLLGVLRAGQILVDCTVPLATAIGGKPTRSLGIWQGSAAQQAQEAVADGVSVVAALHTVGAAKLGHLEDELEEDILICGDRKVDKTRVAHIIEAIDGLRGIDAGPLEMARIVEQLTPLLISINGRYKTHAGIKVTQIPQNDHWG
jgi:NADPH-dependent F420 reductase